MDADVIPARQTNLVISIPASSSSAFAVSFELLTKLGAFGFLVGLSTPFAGGGGLLLVKADPAAIPFVFIGLISGQCPAGVLPMLSNLQKGAGLLSAMWLVGSLTVLGCSTLRL